MSILQISRIQHRRGLQQDLPQLASAELGWSIDQRRLFIGNGVTAEGAPVEGRTEILTQHSQLDFTNILKLYSFTGEAAAGYVARTGFGTVPTTRSMQDKFDDIVSVKDFGAKGDGVTNDLVAITRAITEIYRKTVVENRPSVRRAILFPAGDYMIQGGVAVFPTWLSIVGDGIMSTRIVQTDAAQECTVRFSDSAFEFGTNAGAPFITLPTAISIEKMTLHNTAHKDVVLLDGVTDSNFRLVAFSGSMNLNSFAVIVPDANAGIKFLSTKRASNNITFDSCAFGGTQYAVVSDVASANIKFNNCLFTELNSAFRLGENSVSAISVPSNFRINNSVFRDITHIGINCFANVTGVVSAGNSFNNVGSNGPIIVYRDKNNYSLYDSFDTENSENVILSDAKSVSLQANAGLTLGTARIGTGDQVILSNTLDSTAVAISGIPQSGVINYQLQNESDRSCVQGTLSFSGDSYVDNCSTSPTIDVVLSIINYAVVYKNNSAATISFRYNINHF